MCEYVSNHQSTPKRNMLFEFMSLKMLALHAYLRNAFEF